MSHVLPESMQQSWDWNTNTVTMGYEVVEKMERAVMKVWERLIRATTVLNTANIPYAVVGGNAVASYVARVDEGAVRNTRDIDILVRREDLERIKIEMAKAGFEYQFIWGVDTFLDGPNAKPSESIHLLFANEKIKPDDPVTAPSIETELDPAGFCVEKLQSLVQMKLLSFRDKDRTHLRDLIETGMIDPSWISLYPDELSSKLKQLFDTPGG